MLKKIRNFFTFNWLDTRTPMYNEEVDIILSNPELAKEFIKELEKGRNNER